MALNVNKQTNKQKKYHILKLWNMHYYTSFIWFVCASVLWVCLGYSGDTFLPLSVEAERAARRCEFCLDHIKQWAIFIWELALCTVGKTEHCSAPQKKRLYLRCMSLEQKSTYLTTCQRCLLSEESDILWADSWVWWCDYWNDSSTMWLESWYLVWWE